VVWAVLHVLWPVSPSASWWSSCGQWRLFVVRLLLLVSSSWLVLSMLGMQVSPYACYCLSLLRGWCVVYVGDASVSLRLLLLVSSSWLVCCLCWRCKCLLTPVIARLFFVAGVLSMLEMQVSPYTCYCLSLLRGWCCLCWRCKCLCY
jgi:hypothetical protein